MMYLAFNDEFSIFSSACGFFPKLWVYRPETKGKVEVAAKLNL